MSEPPFSMPRRRRRGSLSRSIRALLVRWVPRSASVSPLRIGGSAPPLTPDHTPRPVSWGAPGVRRVGGGAGEARADHVAGGGRAGGGRLRGAERYGRRRAPPRTG